VHKPLLLPPIQQGIEGYYAKAIQHTELDWLNQATLEAQDPWNFFDHRSQGVQIPSLHQSFDPFDDPPLAKGVVCIMG
jgi:hypothetical protein